MEFLVCLKWTSLRVETDPLTGVLRMLPGRYGVDPASRAALEWALRLAAAAMARVTVVTVGPLEAEEGLRQALALGAQRAVRLDAPLGGASGPVARAVAEIAEGAQLVLTGAWSIDSGSAAVAPTIAALLVWPQACGLLSVAWEGGELVGERRLPAGVRERLRIRLPAVVSLESGTIALRRESLPGLLGARRAGIELVHPSHPVSCRVEGSVGPYRPRPRTLPPRPVGDDPRARIAALSGVLDDHVAAQQVILDPPEAARAILDALHRWGYA